MASHLEQALYADARAFLARPGKAFRARLIDVAYRLAGGTPGALPSAALEAVELLHGGSLIVDDIQDDAETRRGGPALHRAIGTPRALNTGNWLYFVALARLDALELAPYCARALSRAAHACLVRCHEGQALDLALSVAELRRTELAEIVHAVSAMKTGALTAFAAQVGGSVAGAESRALEGLVRFGEQVGIALQMLDDLGAFVSPARAHKAHEDLRGKRVGWMWAWAAESLDEITFKQLLKQLARDGEGDALRERLAEAAAPLGQQRVEAALAAAERLLHPTFSGHPAIALVRDELTRLGQSYG